MRGEVASFKRMIFVRLILAMLLAIVMCATASGWILLREVHAAGRKHALELASVVVASVPALGVDLLKGGLSSPNALSLSASLVRGDVIAAEYLTDPNTRVSSSGQVTREFAECLASQWPADSHPQIEETPGGWCVLQLAQTFDDGSRVPRVLGGVKLMVSKQWEQVLVRNVLFVVGLVWALTAVTAVWLALRSSRSAIGPLAELATAMHEAKPMREGRGKIPVRAEWPYECVVMANAANELLGKLDEEARTLERKVQERTKELREAHDKAQSGERYTAAIMAGMSHEIRTPLHVMQAYVKLIVGELEFIPDSEQATKFCRVVLAEMNNLLERFDELLRYSAAQAGSQSIRRELCDLRVIGAAVHERCESVAQEQKNVLQVVAPENVVVVSDRQLLVQIVSNLTLNACKFTRRGSVSVTITYLCESQSVYVVVEDDGPGFARKAGMIGPPEVKEEVAQTKRFKGMGMGLEIVQRFVDLLGGKITIDSQPGQGTVARVHVPAEHVTAPASMLETGEG